MRKYARISKLHSVLRNSPGSGYASEPLRLSHAPPIHSQNPIVVFIPLPTKLCDVDLNITYVTSHSSAKSTVCIS